SGGEKRRVALASVLSLGPQVWLLDEPTTGLDPRSQSWLIDFIIAQGQASQTVVTATHDLTIVEAIADTCFVFDESHHLAARGARAETRAEGELLLRCTLVHEHRHRHDDHGPEHSHAHSHLPLHAHGHEHHEET